MTPKLTLKDVDITCGPGWIPIIQRLLDELNQASVQITGMRALETHGRLRLHYTDIGRHIFGEVGMVMVLAEFRSMYICETCGAPGEYRRDENMYLTTHCIEHQSPAAKAGERRHDLTRRPWRQMTEGDYEYDPVRDMMIRLPGRLHRRYPAIFVAEPRIDLDPAAEAIVDVVVRAISRMPLAEAYRVAAIHRDADGHLIIDDNLVDLPPGPELDLLRAELARADDLVSKLPKSSSH